MRSQIIPLYPNQGQFSSIRADLYGNKAYWLSWLAKLGYRVPYTLFLPAWDSHYAWKNSNTITQIKSHLEPIMVNGMYSVAIRSSSTVEDSSSKSYAGHFLTVLDTLSFDEILESIERVRESIRVAGTTARMGVIIQELIPSEVSGVAFSSNPVSLSKYEVAISAIRGLGENLVSGKWHGEDIKISLESNQITEISNNALMIEREILDELVYSAKKIESKLSQPVDIEWAVANSRLFFLQCRPQTSHISLTAEPVLVKSGNLSLIPAAVQSSKKISLRLDAENSKSHISKAYVLAKKNGEPIPGEILKNLEISSHAVGYSVVVLYPEKTKGKIVRKFSSHADLFKTIRSISRLIRRDYWEFVVIIQEIYNPLYTGIVKRTVDSTVVEIARGHFVPKGLVPASCYVLSNDEIQHSYEVEQSFLLEIRGENVNRIYINPPEKISLTKDFLFSISQAFSTFIEQNKAVEFGVLLSGEQLVPYLIDAVDTSTDFSTKNLDLGIISTGKVTGRAVKIDINDPLDNLDKHFHDNLVKTKNEDENFIFICPRADISLLDVVNKFSPKNIGFVFEQVSLLAHFPIILRENHIPAIYLPDTSLIIEGAVYELDATPGTQNLLREISTSTTDN